MIAFEVSINGRRRCLAGIELGILSAIIDAAERDTGSEVRQIAVGGLRQPSGEHVNWIRDPIHVGDEITIKIVEADQVDDAVVRHVGPPRGCSDPQADDAD